MRWKTHNWIANAQSAAALRSFGPAKGTRVSEVAKEESGPSTHVFSSQWYDRRENLSWIPL